MKKLTLSLLISLAAGFAAAQQASYNTPPTISISKVVVSGFQVGRDCGCAIVLVDEQTSASATNDTLKFTFLSTDGTMASFLTALATARSGETGAIGRRINFRILGFLSDNGLLTGVTLTP